MPVIQSQLFYETGRSQKCLIYFLPAAEFQNLTDAKKNNWNRNRFLKNKSYYPISYQGVHSQVALIMGTKTVRNRVGTVC